MITILMSKEDFERNKKALDGFVFWRVVEAGILVRQVAPNKEVTNILNKYSHE